MYGDKIGEMAWMDLSVPNAELVKGFYQQVLGWQSEAVNMSCDGESYVDFSMSVKQSDTTAEQNENNGFATGICHAKGANADMPAVWLPYFLVSDIDVAVGKVQMLKGRLVTNIKNMGDDRYVVIEDPAGAKCALYQKDAK
ncbi:MAG: VOC family protein [Colwellia sp.]|nr:VOC family protein [Colwellia sp.]